MFTENQVLFLQEKFKIPSCKIENGSVIHLGTNKEIPVENLAYGKIKEDGFYYLSEATCGNAINKGIENTEENKLKYGCQVGKPLEGCDAYTKGKCAVYFLEDLSKKTINLSMEKLIDVLNVE